MTRAEQIRNMSDEELAKFLCRISELSCDTCVASKYCHIGHIGFIDYLERKVVDKCD